MNHVIVRAWNKDHYHKDIAILDERQTYVTYGKIAESKGHQLVALPQGVRVRIDPKDFPEMEEFEVIVTGDT